VVAVEKRELDVGEEGQAVGEEREGAVAVGELVEEVADAEGRVGGSELRDGAKVFVDLPSIRGADDLKVAVVGVCAYVRAKRRDKASPRLRTLLLRRPPSIKPVLPAEDRIDRAGPVARAPSRSIAVLGTQRGIELEGLVDGVGQNGRDGEELGDDGAQLPGEDVEEDGDKVGLCAQLWLSTSSRLNGAGAPEH
jgi:hypothetical protein